MTPLHLQRLLALIFLLLGAWCLLFPGSVESLALRPEHQMGTIASRLLVGCFGAQACLLGLALWLARLGPRAFLWFGLLASLPFFGFNYYFYFVEPVFTPWILADTLGNLGILLTCLYARRLLLRGQPSSAADAAR